MPDVQQQRLCPACGRQTAMNARTCENCGASFAGGVVLTAEPENRSVYSSEFPTVRDGSWQDVAIKTEHIPLPPQIRAEALRREKEWQRHEAEQKAEHERRESQRREEERRLEAATARVAAAQAEQERLRMEAVAKRTQRLEAMLCSVCGTPAEKEAKVRFSFCGVCGADLIPADNSQVGLASGPQQRQEQKPQETYVWPTAAVTAAEQQRQAFSASATVTMGQSATGPRANNTFSPMFCAVAGFFVPGLGQVLNGQGAKGLLLLVAGLFLTANVGFWGVTMVIARLLMALDAYRITEKRRRGETIGKWEWDIQ